MEYLDKIVGKINMKKII